MIVIGGGLIGVTTAYELQHRGFDVTLLEAHSIVAAETSFANGSTLTPSMSDPWNGPGVHWHLIKSFRDPNSPMKLRASALPRMARWGAEFLWNSKKIAHNRATLASFELAKHSTARTFELSEHLGLRYNGRRSGSLKVFRDQSAMVAPLKIAERLSDHGLKYEIISSGAAVASEPALAPIKDQIVGALWYPEDGIGDARLFCEELVQRFSMIGGKLRLNTNATGLELNGGAICGVMTSEGALPASKVVIAMGAYSANFVKQVRLRLPIYPVKGYTLTLPAPPGSPTIPVVDDSVHAVVVRLGERIRIAGTAEFSGFNRSIRGERIDNLRRLFETIYPEVAKNANYQEAVAWAGLRPMSADGLPFIGETGTPGLYINSGHGHLGFTCAAGSADLIADLIEKRAPSIDAKAYSPLR